MKNINVFVFLLAVACLGLGGCEKNNTLSELKVTIAQEKINVIKLENNISDNNDVFKPAFKEKFLKKIKNINIGEKVTLDVGNDSFDKLIIQEIFLNSIGENLYSDETIKNISFTQEKNCYFFKVEKSLVSALSSEYFEGKKDLRGYKIITIKGKTKEVYGFVIKTDSY